MPACLQPVQGPLNVMWLWRQHYVIVLCAGTDELEGHHHAAQQQAATAATAYEPGPWARGPVGQRVVAAGAAGLAAARPIQRAGSTGWGWVQKAKPSA